MSLFRSSASFEIAVVTCAAMSDSKSRLWHRESEVSPFSEPLGAVSVGDTLLESWPLPVSTDRDSGVSRLLSKRPLVGDTALLCCGVCKVRFGDKLCCGVSSTLGGDAPRMCCGVLRTLPCSPLFTSIDISSRTGRRFGVRTGDTFLWACDFTRLGTKASGSLSPSSSDAPNSNTSRLLSFSTGGSGFFSLCLVFCRFNFGVVVGDPSMALLDVTSVPEFPADPVGGGGRVPGGEESLGVSLLMCFRFGGTASTSGSAAALCLDLRLRDDFLALGVAATLLTVGWVSASSMGLASDSVRLST